MEERLRWAAKHFPEVHTIEKDEQLFRAHHDELPELEGVASYLGDSRKKLPEILDKIGGQSAVFLVRWTLVRQGDGWRM
jgi:hypothetical protein